MLDDYRQLFDSHPQPMLIYEMDTLQLLAVNHALVSTTGFTHDELVGQSLLVLHPPDDHDRVRTLLAPVQAGQVLGFHRTSKGLRHLHRDGTVVEVEAAGQATEFKGKKARLVMISEVGDRLRHRQLVARHAALFDRARDIILFIGTDGRILDANPAAVRAYGYWREELLSLRISDLRDPATVADIRKQMQRAGTDGILFSTLHRRKSGETFPVEVNSVGIDLEGEHLLLSVIRDQTGQDAAEGHLRQLLREAADELESPLMNAASAGKLAQKLRRAGTRT